MFVERWPRYKAGELLRDGRGQDVTAEVAEFCDGGSMKVAVKVAGTFKGQEMAVEAVGARGTGGTAGTNRPSQPCRQKRGS